MDTSKKTIAPPVQSLSAKVATPSASRAGGDFVQVQTIMLSCETDGATIYYTLDGTAPSQSKTLYAGPIELSKSATIKAKAYKTGLLVSDEMSETYNISNV